jgi:16S rRNA (cytosine967-C5)-methyltransferase
MSPRQLAFEVLSRGTKRPGGAAQLIEERLTGASMTASERALTLELVHGVIRRQGTLDAILGKHLNRPLENVEPGARALLQLGIYQLVFLSGAPAYAVVNETTELAKKAGKPQWTGFVNGVLRAVARAVTDEHASEPAADAVPLQEGRYRRMRQRIFADPALDFAGYFAAAFSFPHWLVERWQRRFDQGAMLGLGFWFNSAPRLTLRVNSLRSNREEVLASLERAGIAARPGTHPESVRLEQSVRVVDLPGFAEGQFTVQDESAMGAATLLAPQPGERILDLCAAPGGKSSHLAALMRNEGSVLAVDVDEERLALIDQTCHRLGLSIIESRLVQRDLADVPSGPFDAILMDVPCSNTGVLGKRPEVRWRMTPGDLTELVELQRRLFEAAFQRLSPGGRLLYSTCSIEPEENQGVVAEMLTRHSDLRLVEEKSHIPGSPADGGFQALLRRA